jgi:hypothetical protein
MLQNRANQDFVHGKIFKRESMGLRETVRDVTGRDMTFQYHGIVRSKKVEMDSYLAQTKAPGLNSRMPKETPLTLEMRFMHELGFYVKPQLMGNAKRGHYVRKGERKARPFLRPAAESLQSKLVSRLVARLS